VTKAIEEVFDIGVALGRQTCRDHGDSRGVIQDRSLLVRGP